MMILINYSQVPHSAIQDVLELANHYNVKFPPPKKEDPEQNDIKIKTYSLHYADGWQFDFDHLKEQMDDYSKHYYDLYLLLPFIQQRHL